MALRATETNLDILLVGDGQVMADLCTHLSHAPLVRRVRSISNLHNAWKQVDNGEVNTVIIDPFLNDRHVCYNASKFILMLRKAHPEIVFVLYVDHEEFEKQVRNFPVETGIRLIHYYTLDKKLAEKELYNALGNVLTRCEMWLKGVSKNKRGLYDYDVALSFAGEDRHYADELAKCLSSHGIHVFYDSYEEAELWGKDLFVYLHSLYSKRSQYCVIFISSAYATKMWTIHERRSAQERALKERESEYILPIRIDDTELPGLLDTIAYISINRGITDICKILRKKLE